MVLRIRSRIRSSEIEGLRPDQLGPWPTWTVPPPQGRPPGPDQPQIRGDPPVRQLGSLTEHYQHTAYLFGNTPIAPTYAPFEPLIASELAMSFAPLGRLILCWASLEPGSDRKDTSDEKADREHLPDPRRGHAGPGRTWRGRQRRLHARWLVGELLGRADGSGHGRGDEHAVRPPSRAQDLRHLRRLLATRAGGSLRQTVERRHQVRRVSGSSHAGVGPLGADRGRRRRRRHGAQDGRWTRATGAWQREPDPDALAPHPCRPVPPVGLPPRHRVRKTPVLGRHHPLRAEARRQQGLQHWSRDRYLRAG